MTLSVSKEPLGRLMNRMFSKKLCIAAFIQTEGALFHCLTTFYSALCLSNQRIEKLSQWYERWLSSFLGFRQKFMYLTEKGQGTFHFVMCIISKDVKLNLFQKPYLSRLYFHNFWQDFGSFGVCTPNKVCNSLYSTKLGKIGHQRPFFC